MLHIVNKSPFESNALDACLKRLTDGAAVLLIEDGVYAAVRGVRSSISDALDRACDNGAAVYALTPDLVARGFNGEHIIKKVRVVDYEGFVDLVTGHDNVQTW